jgi:hypothetical protein
VLIGFSILCDDGIRHRRARGGGTPGHQHDARPPTKSAGRRTNAQGRRGQGAGTTQTASTGW